MSDKKRTLAQNKAMHKYFEMLANALNEAGYDMAVMADIAPKFSADWTKTAVKDRIWKPFQDAMFDKLSTTEIEPKDVRIIYENINKRIAELTGVSVPFPSINEFINAGLAE